MASGMNDIEYGFHLLATVWKWLGIALTTLILAPVLVMYWALDAQHYQAAALQAMNAAPLDRQITLDFNTCPAPMGFAEATISVLTEVLGAHPANYDREFQGALPFTATGGDALFFRYSLPWAPRQLIDPLLVHRPEASLVYTELAAPDTLSLVHYRNLGDKPHEDPWYAHGLFKMAPTQTWDWGTGPDYAFGKTAGNYRAYVAATRATAAMRLLLGGRALGCSGRLIAAVAASPEYQNPAVGFAALRHLTPGATGTDQARATFIRGYCTNWGTRLPVVTLDLQKFDPALWKGVNENHPGDLEKFMGWWPLGQRNPEEPPRGNGEAETRDFFITGLRLRGHDAREGRPQFSRLDFLVYRLPSTTPEEDCVRSALLRTTQDAFWSALLPGDAETQDGARRILARLRQELKEDTTFARRYGHVVFSGDKMGRGPSIMKQ